MAQVIESNADHTGVCLVCGDDTAVSHSAVLACHASMAEVQVALELCCTCRDRLENSLDPIHATASEVIGPDAVPTGEMMTV